MPDLDKLLGGSRISQDMFQYPHEKLYNAAARLRPEDRPTVPVQLTKDPASIFARYKGYKEDALPEAFTLPAQDRIYVNQNKSSIFNNPDRLAGNLGHEQAHIVGGDERNARMKEIQVLQGMGKEKRQVEDIKRYYGIK